MQLSEHFTLAEMTHSVAAKKARASNSPSAAELRNLQRLCNTLELVRAAIVSPVTVTSGYRSAEVNRLVGGSKTSAHMQGLAADFIPGDWHRRDAARLIIDAGIEFDQLIVEPSWLHIGLAPLGTKPRQQVLTKFKGDPRYYPGIVSPQEV